MIEQSYIHPLGEVLLEETKNLLSSSPLGEALLARGLPQIIVLKGPLSQAYVHLDKIIYLRIPALQKKARIEQAIDLAGALLELQINAETPQNLDPDTLKSEEILVDQHLRNVEIIYDTLPIVSELEQNGHKAEREIRLMGLGRMYRAWKTGASLEECANIYWDIFETKEDA